MSFLRRGKRSGEAIADFWRWWPDARGRVENAIAAGEWDGAFVDEIGAKVRAIHPDLAWEFATGRAAQHALVVCSGGDPALRAIAERWRVAAPSADGGWEFHSTRQPHPDELGRLRIHGRELDLAELRFALRMDLDRAEVDVSAYHPAFAAMPENARIQVTFLALDWALGERAVELWLGAVDSATEPPERPQTVRGLRAAVAEVEERTDEDRWAVLGGSDDRGVPMIASVRFPLKAVRWPRFDTHVAVVLPYLHRLDNGFPDDASLVELRAFEDRLIAAVRGGGELVAHESRNGRRTLHVYVDGTGPADTTVRQLLPGWMEGRATASSRPDPHWKGVAHLRA